MRFQIPKFSKCSGYNPEFSIARSRKNLASVRKGNQQMSTAGEIDVGIISKNFKAAIIKCLQQTIMNTC